MDNFCNNLQTLVKAYCLNLSIKTFKWKVINIWRHYYYYFLLFSIEFYNMTFVLRLFPFTVFPSASLEPTLYLSPCCIICWHLRRFCPRLQHIIITHRTLTKLTYSCQTCYLHWSLQHSTLLYICVSMMKWGCLCVKFDFSLFLAPNMS